MMTRLLDATAADMNPAPTHRPFGEPEVQRRSPRAVMMHVTSAPLCHSPAIHRGEHLSSIASGMT